MSTNILIALCLLIPFCVFIGIIVFIVRYSLANRAETKQDARRAWLWVKNIVRSLLILLLANVLASLIGAVLDYFNIGQEPIASGDTGFYILLPLILIGVVIAVWLWQSEKVVEEIKLSDNEKE